MINTIRIEPLEDDEFDFIQKRYDKESKAYMFGMNMILLASVLVPLGAALFYYLRFHQTDIMIKAFLYALSVTALFSLIVGFFGYQRSLADLKKDLKSHSKLVESCLITEKKYMSLNHTYHFFLDSVFKYSIEVSEEDFNRFQEQDEINIEYTKYSREYFGYY